MSDEKALIPVEQQIVDFYGDELIAVAVEVDGKQQVYVPVRPICDYLGLAFAAQRRRILRDPVLTDSVQYVTITATKGEKRGNPNRLCIPLDYVSGFLFGVSVQRVKPELQERLIRYQKECYKVLDEAVRLRHLSFENDVADLLDPSSEAVQAYRMLQALTKLAHNQIVMEARLNDFGRTLNDNTQRIEELESTLGNPQRAITQGQASRISQAVKAIALELGRRSGRNEFGGVYGELYRRFDIAAYRELPSKQYDDAMTWLRDWYSSLTGEEVPF